MTGSGRVSGQQFFKLPRQGPETLPDPLPALIETLSCPGIITTELACMGSVVIITDMRPKTLITGLLWLAIVAIAAQGLGAAAFVDACQCQACECGQQVTAKSCCSKLEAQNFASHCGKSCCGTTKSDCEKVVTTLGSCCCGGAELPTPLNPPKSHKTSSDKAVSTGTLAISPVATFSTPTFDGVEIGLRHESPPLRILYCVWRN